MEKIQCLREVLELIYFLSGPILAAGVIIALLQYSQEKKDSISKYEREIVSSTINDIHNFNYTIETDYDLYTKSLNGKMEFTYSKEYINLSDNDLFTASNKYFETLSEDSVRRAKDLAMELNKFSLSFTFLLSDDKKAKELIGFKYIQIYESILFMISHLTINNHINLESTFKLYKLWNSQSLIVLTKQKIEENKRKLQDLEDASKKQLNPIGRY